MHLYLASTSPRRAELLRQLGLKFERIAPSVDESRVSGESAQAYVCRLSALKARTRAPRPDTPVLGADTIVVIDDRILGKPKDRCDGLDMLAALSGRTHRVLTAVTVAMGGRDETAVSESRVAFRALTSREIETYWRTGEPGDKAGGYAVQGIGAVFVRSIEGSYSGVVGLPLTETAAILKRFGVDCLEIAAGGPGA